MYMIANISDVNKLTKRF